MNVEILFSDAHARLILALGIGIVVMLFLLVLEILYQKKHPEAFVEKPSKDALKHYGKHISNMFIIIFVYVFSLLAFIATFDQSWNLASLSCFLVLAILMIWQAYNVRK